MMRCSRDDLADAVYITVQEGEPGCTWIESSDRFVHYLRDGSVHAVEFLYVSEGVDLSGLPPIVTPYLPYIAAQLDVLGVSVLNFWRVTGNASLPQVYACSAHSCSR